MADLQFGYDWSQEFSSPQEMDRGAQVMGLHDDSEETRRIGVWDERSERPCPLDIKVAQLTVNAIYMAYAIVCKSSKSTDDLNAHLAACLAQDPTLAVSEALDILRAGLERGEWFEES